MQSLIHMDIDFFVVRFTYVFRFEILLKEKNYAYTWPQLQLRYKP